MQTDKCRPVNGVCLSLEWGPNLFVDISLLHSHAIAVIERRRVADRFLNEEYESGNGACRRIMQEDTVAY